MTDRMSEATSPRREIKMLDNSVQLQEIMDNAMLFCAEKVGLRSKEEVMAARKQGDCALCDYLRYGLAKELSAQLASLDETIKAVYVYEPEIITGGDSLLSTGPPMVPAMNMIVWVSRKTAALESLLASTIRGLEEQLMELGCDRANSLCHMLDTNLVDDEEVRASRGYGALLSSVQVLPIPIWRRSAEI
jgi:hypothetical protein